MEGPGLLKWAAHSSSSWLWCSQSVLSQNVLASSASRVTTWNASLSLAIVRCLQLRIYQVVSMVLGPVISYNRGFGYGSLLSG